MKRVLSVSLGSSARDHSTEAEFMGEHFWLSRQGTDGDFDRYINMYHQYDGEIDAFGVGGAEFYLWVNNRRYYFREIKKVRQVIKISKVGDGNGVKHLLAPLALQALREHGVELLGNHPVLAGIFRFPFHLAFHDRKKSSDFPADFQGGLRLRECKDNETGPVYA